MNTPRIKSILTFFQHANFETFHETTRLARLASPFGDLTLVAGWTAVLNIPCRETNTVTVNRVTQKDNLTVNAPAGVHAHTLAGASCPKVTLLLKERRVYCHFDGTCKKHLPPWRPTPNLIHR